MDDAMLDLMAERGGLRQRLDAYAEDRLTPSLGATTRMRSRVLAVAHRRSALLKADVHLALVPDPIDLPESDARADATATPRRLPTIWRRTATVMLAAGLAAAAVSGMALAAQPGGGLYGARVWAETLVLPMEQPQRAIAELERLDQRIAEIQAATARNDDAAARTAIAEYEHIVEQAAADVDRAGDAVAEAALQQGVNGNIAVLTALVDRLPDRASEAVGAALDRAIERSTEALESIKPGNGNGGGGSHAGGNGNGQGQPAGPNATKAPAATNAPTATPAPTAKPTKTPKPEATPKPTPTAKPTATPKPPSSPNPGNGGGGGGRGGGPSENNGQSGPRPDPPGQGD